MQRLKWTKRNEKITEDCSIDDLPKVFGNGKINETNRKASEQGLQRETLEMETEETQRERERREQRSEKSTVRKWKDRKKM